MKTKNVRNTILSGALACGLLMSLVACASHTNPLKTVSHEKAAIFLVKASEYASQTTHNYWSGTGYGNCMDTHKYKKSECKKFYQVMLTYAKTKPHFKSLNLADCSFKMVCIFNSWV